MYCQRRVTRHVAVIEREMGALNSNRRHGRFPSSSRHRRQPRAQQRAAPTYGSPQHVTEHSCSRHPWTQVARPTTQRQSTHGRRWWYRLRAPYVSSISSDSSFICSPVKNVVLAGFGYITLLDLDTIDLSNLNRQFLFRKKDVKQSKALVCCSCSTRSPYGLI
jgi:hypothetical protein